MGKRIVDNIDDSVWHVFSGYCKAKRVLIGKELTDILKKELNKKGDKFAA